MKNSKLVLDEDTTNFLRELKTLRENSGLTREETALIIGVTADTIAHYECGTRPPSAKAFIQLATLFKYDISENINYKFYFGKVDYAKIKSQIRSLGLDNSTLARLAKYSQISVIAAINHHRDSSVACLAAVLDVLKSKAI